MLPQHRLVPSTIGRSYHKKITQVRKPQFLAPDSFLSCSSRFWTKNEGVVFLPWPLFCCTNTMRYEEFRSGIVTQEPAWHTGGKRYMCVEGNHPDGWQGHASVWVKANSHSGWEGHTSCITYSKRELGDKGSASKRPYTNLNTRAYHFPLQKIIASPCIQHMITNT